MRPPHWPHDGGTTTFYGYRRLRRHLEEDCTPVDSGRVVALLSVQEMLGVGEDRMVLIESTSGDYTHHMRFFGSDVVARVEGGEAVVLSCTVHGATLQAELLEHLVQ